MSESGNKNRNNSYFAIGRGIVSAIITFVIYKLTVFSVKVMATTGGDGAIFKGLPDWAVYLTAAISAYLIYNSVVTAFSYYSPSAREIFIAELSEKDVHEIFFTEQMSLILRDKESHIEAASSILPILLIAALGGFSEIPRIFFPAGEYDAGFIAPLALLPVCAAAFYLSKYEARRFWLKLWREKNTKKLSSLWGLALRFAILLVLYPTVYPWAPLLAFVFITLGAVIAELTNLLTVIGLIAAVVLLFLASLGIKLLCAMRKRKKFLDSLKRISAEKGVTLSRIKYPYKSFIDETSDCSFTVEYGSEKFDCVLISTTSKNTPFIFNSATGGYFRHRLGTKNHHIGFSRFVSFFHSGDGKRIVILSPSPKYVFIEDMGMSKQIIGWEHIFGFTVHDETSFLGGLDRLCLEKYEPKH